MHAFWHMWGAEKQVIPFTSQSCIVSPANDRQINATRLALQINVLSTLMNDKIYIWTLDWVCGNNRTVSDWHRPSSGGRSHFFLIEGGFLQCCIGIHKSSLSRHFRIFRDTCRSWQFFCLLFQCNLLQRQWNLKKCKHWWPNCFNSCLMIVFVTPLIFNRLH